MQIIEYPKSVLKSIVKNSKRLIHTKRMFGQIGMPTEAVLELSNAAFLVTDMKLDKYGRLFVEFETLDTKEGKKAQKLLEKNTHTIRTSGFGTLRKEGNVDVVNNDYQLIAMGLVKNTDAA